MTNAKAIETKADTANRGLVFRWKTFCRTQNWYDRDRISRIGTNPQTNSIRLRTGVGVVSRRVRQTKEQNYSTEINCFSWPLAALSSFFQSDYQTLLHGWNNSISPVRRPSGATMLFFVARKSHLRWWLRLSSSLSSIMVSDSIWPGRHRRRRRPSIMGWIPTYSEDLLQCLIAVMCAA